MLEVRVAGAAAVQEPKRIQIESTGDAGAPSISTGEPGAEGPEVEGLEGSGEPPR